MHDSSNRSGLNIEKPFPGCMGRVVNLLDFGPRMTANRLLTDKPHSDDLVKKAFDPTRDQAEGKIMPNELRRSSSKKKSNGTPMKMLIAQEMSKEVESKQKPPSLVAKLMGLDTLPEQQLTPTSQRSQTRSHLQNSLSRPQTPPRYLQPEGGFLDKQMQCGMHPFQDQQEYKDVYEVWQQSPKISNVEQHKSQGHEKPNDAGMDLVRQKFKEAKRLATDENLRQSKEFQEALEVLSSNKELFLKFLQEPNSLFSQQLYELQSVPSFPHTKRITVLRPSKSMGNNRYDGFEETSKKPVQKQNQLEVDAWNKNMSRSSSLTSQKNDCSIHPTRIVVLKPSPGKSHNIKAVASSPSMSPRMLHSRDYFGESEDDEAQSSRVVAKEITEQMRDTLSSYPREDTMLSSVFSNGYVGDESSFNRSDNEYVGEGNLSDSEIMTPTSKISWDYVNKLGSPFSSSFSRVSCSPESSVCREAKKRLSERWAMMTTNGNGEEQRQVRRSSSTLGEMLALSETKKLAGSTVEGIEELSVLSSRSCGGEQELTGSTSCLSSSEKKDETGHDSPKNLLRSRSVPVSSTAYGSRLNVEVPDSENSKSNIPKEAEKSKNVKSSFKGKVSSLFFLRNKKNNKDKSKASPSADSQNKCESAIAEAPKESEQHAPIERSDDISRGITKSDLEEGPSPNPGVILSKTDPLPSAYVEKKQGTVSHEAVLSIEKTAHARIQSENHDQPSPVSVLDASFEDEDTTPQSAGSVKPDLQGSVLLHHPLQSNLISKSPPIESLARSLSWDDASIWLHKMNQTIRRFRLSRMKNKSGCYSSKNWFSSAGLDNKENFDTIFSSWHSQECPLDPLLLGKFVNLQEDKLPWHEARGRQRRSKQKLIFDCINEALVDIKMYKSNASLWVGVSSAGHKRVSLGEPVTAEDIWNRLREWFSENTKCFAGESDDNNSLVVERVVKKEVVGREWIEHMSMEVDGIGKEIEGKVLEELVEDTLFELTGWLH
ncbi:hypothetical protein IFM89_019665 [Coptis chinensis]|uniref:DUF4378 domain-containing protein n=1 Tax=Coptis chinensis TaxID=261450 RepID=A0A835HZW5_9MAGN|nr:hypothetical protein IFM89_019665 [Coptis chinensis]